MESCNNEVIDNWLNYIDNELIPDTSELRWYKKTFVLDSIEVLNFIRTYTNDIPTNRDDRLQFLIDSCLLPCRNDYYQRFLGFNSKYYRSKNDWWVDCWQSIRLNNILHEMDVRSISCFFSESSDGREFSEKWANFFNHSNDKKEISNSLPAFSYLECVRFLTNLGEELPIDNLIIFLQKLCIKENNELEFLPKSTEIRAFALNVIDMINRKSSNEYDFNNIYSNLISTLKFMLLESEWNEFSHSWAPILINISDNNINNLIESKIPTNKDINPNWFSSNKFIRKPRFALLTIFPKLRNCTKYFEIIHPNPFVYTSNHYIENYVLVANIIDKLIQSLNSNKDLQKKVQDNDIKENYFQDLLKTAMSTHIGNGIKWVEKEGEVGSGRTTDILITVKIGPEIPIEVKLLWRFREGYEPITEVLEQTIKGNLGITFTINKKDNPVYKRKYQGFEGWKNYVKNHDTYISGSIRESDKFFESNGELKSRHFFSDHRFILTERSRNVTLLNFFIDLQDYIRSPTLKELK